MADGDFIDIRGIEETIRELERAPERIVKGAFARALTASAAVIMKAVNPRTPVEHGDLKAALTFDVAIDSQGRGGVAKIGFGKLGWKARLVEYGHRMIGHKPGKKQSGQVTAHPFMRPALETSAEEAIEAFRVSLEESVREMK